MMRQKRIIVSDSMVEFLRDGDYSRDVARFLFSSKGGEIRSAWESFLKQHNLPLPDEGSQPVEDTSVKGRIALEKLQGTPQDGLHFRTVDHDAPPYGSGFAHSSSEQTKAKSSINNNRRCGLCREQPRSQKRMPW